MRCERRGFLEFVSGEAGEEGWRGVSGVVRGGDIR